MNFGIIGLVLVAYPVMFVIANMFGAGTVIREIEDRVGDMADDVRERVENLWYTQIVPRLRRLVWFVVGALAFAVILAILATIEDSRLWWNIIVTALIAGGFSFWLYRIWDKTPDEFSLTSLINAAFLGSVAIGLVEFYLGNQFRSRALVQIGTFYLLFALLGIFKQGVRLVVKLAAIGVFSLEGMTNFVTSLAVGLITVGKSSLKDVFGPTGAQIAKEEDWEPKAAAAMSRLVAATFPMLIFCNLLPGMDMLAVMVLAGLSIFLMWGTLESVDIKTTLLRQRSAVMVYRLAYPLLVIVALTIMVPGATAELDALRVTVGKLVIGMFRGTNGAIIKVMGSLITLILTSGLLYMVWPKDETSSLPRMRKVACVFIGLAALWSCGKIFMVFAEPEVDKAVAAVQGKYFEKFVPKLSTERVNGRKAVLVKWFEQPETDSYVVMRRGSDERDQAVFHPLLDPNFPGTDHPMIVSQGATQMYDYTAKVGAVYYYQVLALKHSANPCWQSSPAPACDTLESLIIHRSTETRIEVAEQTAPASSPSRSTAVPPEQRTAQVVPSKHSPDVEAMCREDPTGCD